MATKGKTQSYYDKNPAAKKKKGAYDKKYNAKPEEKKRRAGRNAANRKVNPPKGKDVHHKDGNPRNNSKSNLRVESKKTNRGRK